MQARTVLIIFIFGFAVATAAVAAAAPARAEIKVEQAEYAAGILVVRGESTQADEEVTLDGRYSARSDADKRFVFRIPYRPANCAIEIRAGAHARSADVANCKPMGAPTLKPPPAAKGDGAAPR